MTQEKLNQLWQALQEATTAYDYAIIFNYSEIKGDISDERKNA